LLFSIAFILGLHHLNEKAPFPGQLPHHLKVKAK
jgi:hypothetical protein